MPYGDDPAPPVDRLARLAAIGTAAGRIAIGAGIWLAPERSWRALGLAGTPAAGAALALGRMAATRDIVLGAAALAALGDRERLRRVAAGTAVVDAGDVLAFGLALREGGERTRRGDPRPRRGPPGDPGRGVGRVPPAGTRPPRTPPDTL